LSAIEPFIFILRMLRRAKKRFGLDILAS
jgi:hypothetical protein